MSSENNTLSISCMVHRRLFTAEKTNSKAYQIPNHEKLYRSVDLFFEDSFFFWRKHHEYHNQNLAFLPISLKYFGEKGLWSNKYIKMPFWAANLGWMESTSISWDFYIIEIPRNRGHNVCTRFHLNAPKPGFRAPNFIQPLGGAKESARFFLLRWRFVICHSPFR